VTVVRPAHEEGVLVRVGESLPRWEGTAGPARPAEGCQTAPAKVQLNDGRVAAAGVQAEQQAQLRVLDAEPRQAAVRQEAPAQCSQDGERRGKPDKVTHDAVPFWAASTWRRRAVRAAPTLRSTSGASSVQTRETLGIGNCASGP